MHPETPPRRAAAIDRGPAPGVPPPAAPCCGPFLRSLGVDLGAAVASLARHPSAPTEGSQAPRVTCRTCGFTPLACAEAAAALRRLPTAWGPACHGGAPSALAAAAEAGDELLVVAHRAAQLLAEVGSSTSPSALGPVAGSSTSPSGSPSPPAELVVAVLDDRARRLAALVEGLTAEQWVQEGRDGGMTVAVGELANRPLHTAHYELAHRAAPGAPEGLAASLGRRPRQARGGAGGLRPRVRR
ncbi:MAG: hypothetical protein GEV08_22890 [Acidimicrobiia bacterium]|nr:hypothetical protein [Acidimicrobiia bacterium]